MKGITFDQLVDRVKDHADAESVMDLGTILSHEGVETEIRQVNGRGRTLMIWDMRMCKIVAHIWLQESILGFGPKEWVVSSGPRRNFIEQKVSKK